MTPIPLLNGKSVRLSLPRRFVCDLLWFAKKVPSVPMERKMQLADVVEARSLWTNRISWCAIFIKAYSIVSKDRPELRRAFLSFPIARIYEHPENVVSFSLEREYKNEFGVFFGKIASPETLSLEHLDRIVRSHKAAQIESVPSYLHALRLSRIPQPFRRLIWWMGLNWEGRKRAYFFGTFGISVAASQGAAGVHILSPLTTTLNYGVFEPDGSIDVRLAYDHRVLDGAVVARAMKALEDVLHDVIVPELLEGAARQSANSTQRIDRGDDDSSELSDPIDFEENSRFDRSRDLTPLEI